MLTTNLETELNKGIVLCINGWEGNVSITKEKDGVSSFMNKDEEVPHLKRIHHRRNTASQ